MILDCTWQVILPSFVSPQLLLTSKSQGRVVVLMGSISDLAHCEKIKKSCANYGIPCELRVTSAHKGPDETLRIKAEYEGNICGPAPTLYRASVIKSFFSVVPDITVWGQITPWQNAYGLLWLLRPKQDP